MNRPLHNALYQCLGNAPFTKNSTYRLVWHAEDQNIAVLIRTDVRKHTRPLIKPYGLVSSWISDGLLRIVEKETTVPQHRLTDEALTKRFPSSNRKRNDDGSAKLSAPVEYRNTWVPFLRDIELILPDVWRKKRSLSSILSPACVRHKVALNSAYVELYRFLANGSNYQSVISDKFHSGGKGKPRVGKGKVLGRKKLSVKEKNGDNDNFPLTKEWLTRIRDTYRETIKRSVSGGKAYRTFLNLHCMSQMNVTDGKLSSEYLAPNKRPSKSQFLAHGSGDDPQEAMWRKQLLAGEFEKNFRALDGQSEPRTFRSGLLAQVDASSNDRYLVSVFNRAQTVGTARVIPVVEDSTGYIFGIHIAWRVNQGAANLSVLNALSDKVPFCDHYGITINARDWYQTLHAEYRADHGEFNCNAVRQSLGALNRSIEYCVVGRPDLRGRGEQAHRLLHDHDANGSTYGTFRKRGEKDPASTADQNIFDFTRETIRLVLNHNNLTIVDHLLTTEMRQDGVEPTRRGILEWSIAKGYHHQIHYQHDDAVLSLCPEFAAVVTENGIYPIVQRNYDSGDELLLRDLRYLGEFATQQRWLETARRSGRRRITIRMNPNDPRVIWYQDTDYGLQEFHLATQDPLIGRLVTLHDLLSRKSSDAIAMGPLQDRLERARAQTELENAAERKEIAKQKKEHVAKGRGKKGKSGAKGRRDALKKEIAATGQSPVAVPASSATMPPPDNVLPSNVVSLPIGKASPLENKIDSWLDA